MGPIGTSNQAHACGGITCAHPVAGGSGIQRLLAGVARPGIAKGKCVGRRYGATLPEPETSQQVETTNANRARNLNHYTVKRTALGELITVLQGPTLGTELHTHTHSHMKTRPISSMHTKAHFQEFLSALMPQTSYSSTYSCHETGLRPHLHVRRARIALEAKTAAPWSMLEALAGHRALRIPLAKRCGWRRDLGESERVGAGQKTAFVSSPDKVLTGILAGCLGAVDYRSVALVRRALVILRHAWTPATTDKHFSAASKCPRPALTARHPIGACTRQSMRTLVQAAPSRNCSWHSDVAVSQYTL